jgi:hypothetical protein
MEGHKKKASKRASAALNGRMPARGCTHYMDYNFWHSQDDCGLIHAMAEAGGPACLVAALEEEKTAQTKLMWSNLGPIRIDMALDHIPKQAGVYRLTFKLWGNTYTYIGEAGARGLRARIGDYANHPRAEGNKTEHLLHDLLREAGQADLFVCCTGVTLDEQKARRKFEQEAVAATQQEHLMCLNAGGYPVDIPMRRFILKSEEKMLLKDLERVRTKLAKLG